MNENNVLKINKTIVTTKENSSTQGKQSFYQSCSNQHTYLDYINEVNLTIELQDIQQNIISIAHENHPLSLMVNQFNSLHSAISNLKLLNLHFWLWNVRSLNDHKFNYIHSLLCGRAYKNIHIPDIIALTETWMKTSGKFKTFNFKGYAHYSTSRTDGRKGGGVSLHIKSNLNTELINTFSAEFIEVVHVQIILTPTKTVQLVAIYRPPNGCMSNFMSFLETLFSTYGDNLILLGDMNLNAAGSNQYNYDNYADLFHSYGYSKINNAVTFQYRNSTTDGSVLDHLVINNNVGLCCSLTSQKTAYSDHNLIMGSLNFNIKINVDSKIKKHTIRKINKKQALEEAKQYLQYFDSTKTDLNDKCSSLISNISQTLKDNTKRIALKTKETNFEMPPWADESYVNSCNKIYNLQEKIWDLNRKNLPSTVLSSKLIHLKTKIKSMEIRKTQMHYSNLILTNPKVSWDIINELCGRKRTEQKINLKVNNVIINDDKEIAKIFHDKFLTSKECKRSARKTKHRGPYIANTFQFHEVDECYIGNLIMSLATDKSPGCDEVPASFWKSLKDELLPIITELINDMIRTDTFPDELKKAVIVPIYKKGNKSDPKNYRQISLLPALSKIFEKVLLTQMEDFLDKYNILDKLQFGFRKGKGCHDAIALTLHKASNEIDSSNGMILLSLDVASAFDNVSHEILLQKMEYLGFRGKSNNLLRSYLSNRQQCVRIGSEKSDFGKISRGVPQGSLLGPLLFNIMLNDLMNINTCSPIIKYADDALILFTINADIDNINRLQNLLNELIEFYDDNELLLNSSKSQYLCFGKPEKEGIEFVLNSAGFQKCESITYLGIQIKNDLNISSYAENVATKLSQANGVLSNIRYKLPVPVLMKFYYGHLHSHLTYCSFSLLRCNKNEITRLQRCQNRALKLIYNLPNTHPTIDLFETYEPTLLPVVGLIFYSAIVMVKKYILNPEEAAFAITNSSSRRRNEIRTHSSRSSIKKDDLCVSGIALYNNLPAQLRSLCSINQFKRELKKFLLEKRDILLKESQFKDRDLK